MKVKLTCTQAQYDWLVKTAYTGRSRFVEVQRQSLKELLLDHARIHKTIERLPVDLIEPSGT